MTPYSHPYSSITDLTQYLDALITAGWEPCLNRLSVEPPVWHVGLRHATVPPYTVMMTVDGPRLNQDGHRYHIHAHGETLRAALEDALGQVEKLIEPAR